MGVWRLLGLAGEQAVLSSGWWKKAVAGGGRWAVGEGVGGRQVNGYGPFRAMLWCVFTSSGRLDDGTTGGSSRTHWAELEVYRSASSRSARTRNTRNPYNQSYQVSYYSTRTDPIQIPIVVDLIGADGALFACASTSSLDIPAYVHSFMW